MSMFGVFVRAALGVGLMTGVTVVDAGHGVAHPWLHGEDFYDYGDVVRVEPIIGVVQSASPREVCWDEEVAQYEPPRDGSTTYTPVLLGGIVGGIVGNQFGKGKGKDVMTIAGTLLGGSIGYEASRRPSMASSRLTTVRSDAKTTTCYFGL